MATKETERLDDASIERAIELLDNRGTKKDACAILGINYNTTRLASIIDKYKEKKLIEETKRAEKRGKPASEGEKQYVISSYLEGHPMDAIAKSLYRGTTFVRSILDQYSVPIRKQGYSYFTPELIPEEAMRDAFEVGERVWSARYASLAKIISMFSPGVYLIFLESEKWRQFAYQPSYELGSLKHLKSYV